MNATKRSLVLPLKSYWSKHFSTWVIRDGDNQQIGQVDSERKADLIVKAVNLFDEMVDALQGLIAEIQNGGYVPRLEDSDRAYKTGKALGSALRAIAKAKEE